MRGLHRSRTIAWVAVGILAFLVLVVGPVVLLGAATVTLGSPR